jgi:hypothetical protein
VLVVTLLGWQISYFKGGAGREQKRVAAFRRLDCFVQIGVGGYVDLFAGRGSAIESRVVAGLGKLGGAVFVSEFRHISLVAVCILAYRRLAAGGGVNGRKNDHQAQENEEGLKNESVCPRFWGPTRVARK